MPNAPSAWVQAGAETNLSAYEVKAIHCQQNIPQTLIIIDQKFTDLYIMYIEYIEY